MNIFGQLGIVLGICLMGEGVSYLLPITVPASVISLLLLIGLLFVGIVKEKQVAGIADFITSHMTIFFVPACIGIMQHYELILPQIVPFLFIGVITTPLVYGVTAWTVQLMMARKKEDEKP